MCGSWVRLDILSPILSVLHCRSSLDAGLGAGLVHTGGVEGDDVTVGVAHGGGLDLGTGLTDLDGLSRLLRPGNFLKLRHGDGGEDSKDSDGELHFD